MSSLKARLSWSLTLSLILLLALQWFVVSYAISYLTENQLTDRLQLESENLLSIISFNAKNELVLATDRMGAIYQRPLSGSYYVVLTKQQESHSRSLWDASLNIPQLAVGEVRKLKLTGPEAQPLLVLMNGYQRQDQAITIAIAENIKPLQANIFRFQFIYGAISVLGLGIILLVQRRMIITALSPLQKIQENLARLERGESSYLEFQSPLEIAPLIEQINRLLAAMDRKYQRSRESIGNLAHALKTRLTLLNQTAEKFGADSHLESKESIYDSTSALQNIIERELKRARLMGDIRPGRQVDLNRSIPDLIETLKQIYAQKGVSITWETIENPQFMGDVEDLMEMLGNLLDNACKWSNGRVSLTMIGGDSTRFVIEDNGPGASTEHLNFLTRRGYRADESKPGSGLGLAIVNDIVDSYNGILMFDKSLALGGLKVEVKFDQTRTN